tara:strand:- start:1064 stop:1279 length:216 start_codon:yes stop_codon:yes gene_type:complete
MRKKYKKVIDFYNQTDSEQKRYFLELISDKITIPTQKDKGVVVYNLDEELPVIINGIFFQLNTEAWRSLKK